MLIFLTIIFLQVSCLILPGPDFFVTISNSIKYGQKYGIYTALGVAFGILINTLVVYWFGSYLLYKEPLLFKAVIMIGVLYLGYIAFNLYKSVFSKQETSQNTNHHLHNLKSFESIPTYKFFINGVLTNMANAKVIVFFSSMLSLVDQLGSFGKVAVWLSTGLTTGIWFCIVAMFFGNDRLRSVFFRNMKKIETISAIFITVFIIIILIEVL